MLLSLGLILSLGFLGGFLFIFKNSNPRLGGYDHCRIDYRPIYAQFD